MDFDRNRNGVKVVHVHSGSLFGSVPYDVPVVCLSCDHYDGGEVGEYGDRLVGPVCGLNVNFPLRKGDCKRYRFNGWGVRWHELEEVPEE